MGSIFLIISALLPIVTSVLQNYKAISPAVASLITGIEGAATTVVTELSASTTAGTASITATSLLAAISAGVSVLQTQTTLSPVDLLITNAFISAAQAGLAASNVTVVDPSKLSPITPV